MKLLIKYLSVFLLGAFALGFQEIPEKGVPYLKNYSPSEYNYKGKIWAIDTAPNNITYLASDQGLLEFDGQDWKAYKGSEGITRSVMVVNDSLIYTGSDLDFGIWKRNIYNDFEYNSLYPFKNDLAEINEEFWGLHVVDNNTFFVSSNNIYVYNDKNLTKISAPNQIQKSFKVDGTIYFTDSKNGLYKLENLAIQHLTHFPENSSVPEIIGLYEQSEELVLVSVDGLFVYDSEELIRSDVTLPERLLNANIFNFEQVGDSYLAFGTILQGYFITDLNGEILHHINKKKGLQNNTILSLHYSEDGKLWTGMDYGVSFADLNNEFSYFYDYAGDFGTGYTAILNNDDFYLGTNQGLYYSEWIDVSNKKENYTFELVSGTEGQVWDIEEINNQILIGHDKGLFKLSDGKLEQLSSTSGVWTMIPFKGFLLVGTYNGISIFKKSGTTWEYYRKMDLILGSCNQLILENGNILWVNIPNYGIIKAKLNEELNPEERKIFPSEQFESGNHTLIWDEDRIRVKTEQTIYYHNEEVDSFEIDKNGASNLFEDQFSVTNGKPVKLNENVLFYPVFNGFAIKDLRFKKNSDPKYRLIFRNINAFNNTHSVDVGRGAEIPYKLNNITVGAVVPNQKNVLYQFKSDDSKEWSEWSSGNTFDLLDLSFGEHQIFARAKLNGKIMQVERITIKIKAPWYFSWYMLLLYVILMVSVVYTFFMWQTLNMKKVKKKMLRGQQNILREQQEKYDSKLRRLEEKELLADNERLKSELKTKTVKLATKAKQNNEITEILIRLKEKILKLEENPESVKRYISDIKRIVDSHIDSDDNTFEIQIDQLHQEFFDKLRDKYPELTTYDLRLCAYLKLGFNSKEIADLLNIKPSSVYISRSRLRKKLEMETDDDLSSYLNSV